MLRNAGWIPIRTVGSHTTWQGPNGTRYPIPDGHRTISVGVYRGLLKKVEEDESR
jgi:predicted RNA binding protein YcfA (HicA-like mRNA interferase family)